ncbi:unnamed protein product [Symbiodinium sp. CCMP2592]|nr:unnamed protein product [Symbiodinium sp. CCMP2592]
MELDTLPLIEELPDDDGDNTGAWHSTALVSEFDFYEGEEAWDEYGWWDESEIPAEAYEYIRAVSACDGWYSDSSAEFEAVDCASIECFELECELPSTSTLCFELDRDSSGDEFFQECSSECDCEVRAVSCPTDPSEPCEVILDSGADVTVLPAHLFSTVGVAEKQTTRLLDAQGTPIPQMSQRANVSFVVQGLDGREIVFRDRAVLANVRQPLLCAGKLFRGGWYPKASATDDGIMVMCKGEQEFPLHFARNSVAATMRILRTEEACVRMVIEVSDEFLAGLKRQGWQVTSGSMPTHVQWNSTVTADPSQLYDPEILPLRTTLVHKGENKFEIFECGENWELKPVVDIGCQPTRIVTLLTRNALAATDLGKVVVDPQSPLVPRLPAASQEGAAEPEEADDGVQQPGAPVAGPEMQEVPLEGEVVKVGDKEFRETSSLRDLRWACRYLKIPQSGAKSLLWARLQKEIALNKLKSAVQASDAIIAEYTPDVNHGGAENDEHPLTTQLDNRPAVEELVKMASILGFDQVTFRGDSEPSMKKLLQMVQMARTRLGLKTEIEMANPGSSEHQGLRAERYIDKVRRLGLCLLHTVSAKSKVELKSSHPLYQWSFRHAAFLLTRYHVHADGVTSFELVHGRKFDAKIAAFGSVVSCQLLPKPKTKGIPWEKCVYLGRSSMGSLSIVSSSKGIGYARTVRRAAEVYQADALLAMRGVPWNPVQDVVTMRVPRGPRVRVPVLVDAAPPAAPPGDEAATDPPTSASSEAPAGSPGESILDGLSGAASNSSRELIPADMEVGRVEWFPVRVVDAEQPHGHEDDIVVCDPEESLNPQCDEGFASEEEGVPETSDGERGDAGMPWEGREYVEGPPELEAQALADLDKQMELKELDRLLGMTVLRNSSLELLSVDITDAYLQVRQRRPTYIQTHIGDLELLYNLPGQRAGAKDWFTHLLGILKNKGFNSFISNPSLFCIEQNLALNSHVDDMQILGPRGAPMQLANDLKAGGLRLKVDGPVDLAGGCSHFLKKKFQGLGDAIEVTQDTKYAERLQSILGLEKLTASKIRVHPRFPRQGKERAWLEKTKPGKTLKQKWDGVDPDEPEDPNMPFGTHHVLEVVTDADWGSQAFSDRRSISSFCIFINGNLCHAGNKVQKTISLSSAESELMATLLGLSEGIFLKHMLQFLVGPQATVKLVHMVDNAASRSILQRQGLGRMNHLMNLMGLGINHSAIVNQVSARPIATSMGLSSEFLFGMSAQELHFAMFFVTMLCMIGLVMYMAPKRRWNREPTAPRDNMNQVRDRVHQWFSRELGITESGIDQTSFANNGEPGGTCEDTSWRTNQPSSSVARGGGDESWLLCPFEGAHSSDDEGQANEDYTQSYYYDGEDQEEHNEVENEAQDVPHDPRADPGVDKVYIIGEPKRGKSYHKATCGNVVRWMSHLPSNVTTIDRRVAVNKSGQSALELARERGRESALRLEKLVAAAAAGAVATSVSAGQTPNAAPAATSSAPGTHSGSSVDFRILPAHAWQRLYQDFAPITLAPTKHPVAKSAVGSAPDFAACDFRSLSAPAWQRLYQDFAPITLAPTKLPVAKSAVGSAPDFAACDFRSLSAPAWQRLYQDFAPITLAPTKLPVAKSVVGSAPDFAACDFRSLSAPAWQRLYQDFAPITLAPTKLPVAKSAVGCAPDFAACDFRSLSAPAWQRLHQDFAPNSSTEVSVVAAAQPSRLPPSSPEESEESEEETEDDIDAHASPELGAEKRGVVAALPPWGCEASDGPRERKTPGGSEAAKSAAVEQRAEQLPVLRWLCSVIDARLKVPLPPAHARQVRGLLPLGGLDAEKLCVQDLSDGRLLCALVISVRPDVLPKANAVALGRLAQFLKACAALGVKQVSLFTPPDLLPEPSNPPAVLRCLQDRGTGEPDLRS